MRLLLIVSIALLFAISPVAGSSAPVLLFSDMTSASKTGWSAAEPNKGAAISIWGNNLGNSRGSSYVTVNGVDLTSDSDYAQWGEYWPTQYQQRITFWLNSNMADGAGQITVTVDGNTSNPLEFTIRDGRIFFVALTTPSGNGLGTHEDPYLYGNHMLAWGNLRLGLGDGDTIYFREGTYNGISSQGNYIIRFDNEASSDRNRPFALIAYPGEKPRFETTSREGGVGLASRMVFSGFTTDTIEASVSGRGEDLRIVGNDLVGVQRRSGQGTGIINSGDNSRGQASRNVILGNAVHGGRGGFRLDHGIYLAGCATDGGQIVGWNHLYDNDWGRGPIISINSMDDKRLGLKNLNGTRVAHYHRCKNNTVGRPLWPPQYDVPVDQIMDAHYIFNNRVECYPQRATAINVWQLSYYSTRNPPEPEPEPTYVYNNIFDGCGTFDMSKQDDVGWAISSAHGNGHAHFYNNVWYNTGYVGLSFGGGANRLSTTVKNNIFHMNKDVQNGRPTDYLRFSSSGADDWTTIIFENNILFGASSAYTGYGQVGSDTNNTEVDPLFVDPANGDFRLRNGSPAINAGQPISFAFQPPAWAQIARDNNYHFRSGNFDIGAFEYEPGAAPAPTPRPQNNSNATPRTRLNITGESKHGPRMNKSAGKNFRIFTNKNDDDLTFSWRLNGSLVGSAAQFYLDGATRQHGIYNVTVVATDSNTTVSRTWLIKIRTPKKHDITDDDNVDVRDLRVVAKHVIKKRAYRAQYDMNSDGQTNIFDLISMIKEFGRY